jgi:hypothetical protein
MVIHIRRRELLAALGGAAVWPLDVRAQQGRWTGRTIRRLRRGNEAASSQ